jgi:tetratricopeptide (TPR) repeat protein
LRGAPDDPIINVYLGEAYFQQQEYTRAAECLHRAGTGAMSDPKVRLSLVIIYLKMHDKEAATALLGGLPPEALTPQAQAALGVSLLGSELPAGAAPYLEAARRAYPSSPDIAYDLALSQLGARHYTQAIATIMDLIAAGHESSELDNILSEAYEGNKETQPAVDALRKAISLDPEDDNNYLDFASLCIDHQDFNNASKVLEVGLGVDPRSARLLFERGILNAMQDHFDQAEKDFEESARLAPGDSSGYIGLGVTYIETGNTAQAIQVLRKRSALEPNNASLAYLLGEALMRSGVQPGEPGFLEAQETLERSVSLDPGISAPHAALGSIYLNQGKTQAAVDQLEQARAIDPKEKSAYAHLAIAYRRLGQPEKVKEVLSRLQAINAEERENPRQKMKQDEAGAPTN